MESNQTAARAAKRFLEDRIRNDWTYPDLPQEWSASDEEVRDAQEFRERYYGESESSDSDGKGSGASPYKFDSPDSIGDAVANTRSARKRRRRERLESEMKENEGLRIWVDRRDAWTGATSVQKYGVNRHRPQVTSEQDVDMIDRKGALEKEPQPLDASNPSTIDVVPVAPRMFAENPIRASITPKAYSDIYQKIVLSSRTPAVPINLADMSKALVQGWKESDEWPPRPGMIDPLVGKKRGTTGKVTNGHHGGFMERHPHLGKSVGSVKKILHLNGNNHQNAEQGGG